MTEQEHEKEIARLQAIIDGQKKADLLLRASYKWFLEFIRNCMIVAALFYLAQRSGSRLLYAVAIMAGLALAGYCHSLVEDAWPNVDTSNMSQRKMKLSILASTLVLQIICLAITAGLVLTVNKIVDVQITMTKAP
jgi:uncharacterized membrane protein